MLTYLCDVIRDIIGNADEWMMQSDSLIDEITVNGVYDLIVTMTACILVISTIIFVFKFILKLVER